MFSTIHASKKGRAAVVAVAALLIAGLTLDAQADRERRRGRRGSGGDSGETRGGGRGGRGGGAGEVQIEDAGTLKGKVTLKGTAPAPIQLNQVMAGSPACADSHDEPVFAGRVVVNEANELKEVLVWIKDGLPADQKLPRKTDEVVLDQVGCMYHPAVFAFQAGQKFTIKNSDATLHNVHAIGDDGKGKDYFNLAMPTKDMTLDKTGEFRSKDVVVKFKCEVHAWMFAYAAVLEHPYFAVTDENGDFEIPNLPPGKYTVAAWQRKAGEQTMEIEVPANGEASADFVYDFSEKAE